MSKIAIIKTGGKQYKVAEGQVLKVEKLAIETEKTFNIETLMIADDKADIELGKPSLGEKVSALVLDSGKNKKVTVLKYKNKTRYLRNKGHRQEYTKIKISKIA